MASAPKTRKKAAAAPAKTRTPRAANVESSRRAAAAAQAAAGASSGPSAMDAPPAATARTSAGKGDRTSAPPRRSKAAVTAAPSGPDTSSSARPARATYHHGNLREALVAAAVSLIEERGVEKLSVREAALRAGVSPGAPFRHFPSRTALLTAVAEDASVRLQGEVQRALDAARALPPLQRVGVIGHAYLGWAQANPTHFRVISERALVDYEGSVMRRRNAAVRQHMADLFAEAYGPGEEDQPHLQMAARALVYGLARMLIDGHFPEWSLAGEDAEAGVHATLDVFMGLLPPGKS